MNKISKILFTYLILAFLRTDMLYAAQIDKAGLMLYPVRIMLSDKMKHSELIVKNNGYAAGGYNIEIIDVSMPEEGGIFIIDEGKKEEFSAKDLIRVAPKSFEVKAGFSQTLRVAIKPKENLEPGEYRSHIKVLLSDSNLNLTDEQEIKISGINAPIKHKIAMTIPVIYRHGETFYNISLEDAKIRSENQASNKKYFTDIFLSKEGNQSCIGDIEINYIDENNKKYLLKKIKDNVIYRSTIKRKVTSEIELPKNVNISSLGRLSITYIPTDIEKAKSITKEFKL